MKKRWNCFMNKNNLKKWGIIIIISLIIGIIVSSGYAGIQYLREDGNHKNQNITDDNMTLSNVEAETGVYHIDIEKSKITITFPKKTYISKLRYAYAVLENTEAKVKVYADNLYGNIEERDITDYYNKTLMHSTINIHSKVKKIEFDFDNVGTVMEVSDFQIYNGFHWNPFLALIIAVLSFFIMYMVMFKKENAEYPEIALFIMILAISGCVLILQPAICTGWDEQIHLMNVYGAGIGKTSVTSNAAVDNVVANAHWLNWHPMSAFEEHIEEIKSMLNLGTAKSAVIDNISWSQYDVGYIFQIIFLKIGMVIHLPFYICWLLGKSANILLYAIGMAYAMSLLPCGKRLFMVIATAPTALFICTTYTYDVTVTVFLSIGISIFLKMLLTNEKFSRKWQILFVVCMIIGCLPKAVYAPFVLLSMFIPKEKYNSEKECRIYRGILVLVMLLLIASFALPVLFPSGGTGTAVAGDARGGNTSVSGQMGYVLGKPVAYAIVLIRNVWGTFVDFMIGRSVFGMFGYVGEVTQPIIFAILVMVTAMTDNYKDHRVKKLKIQHRAGILICIAVVVAFIWTALYLSFTEVGAMDIAGVQARYYIPFIFLIYLCIQNDKILCKAKVENYQMVVMMASGCFTLWQIFLNFIYVRML